MTYGFYDDGTLGEIFIDLAKAGTALRFWSAVAATEFSIALQHGVPLAALCKRFIGSYAESPSGPVSGHPRITKATSIMDLIARSLAIEFLGREDLADRPPPEPPPPPREPTDWDRWPFAVRKIAESASDGFDGSTWTGVARTGVMSREGQAGRPQVKVAQ